MTLKSSARSRLAITRSLRPSRCPRRSHQVSVQIFYMRTSVQTILAVFSVDLSAYTAEGDDLLCLKLKIDFRK